MTETTMACTNGCGIYREHLTDCDNEKCRGCLPKRAEHGRFCHTCKRRFELMIHDSPTVIRWLTGNMTPAGGGGAKQEHERIRGGGADLPAPLKLELLDLRDLLTDRLTLWVDDWCEFKGLAGPERHTPEADSAYLLTWLHGICALEWVGAWFHEMAETMSSAHALAPWRPEVKRLPGVPCPGCGETNLMIYGGETDVACGSCHILMTEDRFELWQSVLRDERAAS